MSDDDKDKSGQDGGDENLQKAFGSYIPTNEDQPPPSEVEEDEDED